MDNQKSTYSGPYVYKCYLPHAAITITLSLKMACEFGLEINFEVTRLQIQDDGGTVDHIMQYNKIQSTIHCSFFQGVSITTEPCMFFL